MEVSFLYGGGDLDGIKEQVVNFIRIKAECSWKPIKQQAHIQRDIDDYESRAMVSITAPDLSILSKNRGGNANVHTKQGSASVQKSIFFITKEGG